MSPDARSARTVPDRMAQNATRSLGITWIGQGGFLVRSGSTTICVDPYLSDSVLERNGPKRLLPIPVTPGKLKADLVLFTHDHLDHMDPDTVPHISGSIPMAGPPSCAGHLDSLGVERSRFTALGVGDKISIGVLTVTGVFASHTEDSLGYLVDSDLARIYFTGDTLYDEKLREVRKLSPDILVTCINGKLGNMGVTDSARLARELQVKIAIPCHYGMFAENTENPSRFEGALEHSGITCLTLDFNRELDMGQLLPQT